MKQKIIRVSAVVVALFLGSGNAQAETGKGFHTTLIGGGTSSTTTLNRDFYRQGASKDSSDIGGKGGNLGLALGYNYSLWKGLLGGIEVMGLFHNFEATQTQRDRPGTDTKTRLKMSNSFGAALKIGTRLSNNVIGYGKVGVMNSKFELKSENLAASPTTSGKKGSRRTGLLLGLGADFPLPVLGDAFSVGAEYNFLMYQKIAADHAGFAKVKATPRLHMFNVRISYHF